MTLVMRLALGVLLLLCCNISAQQPGCSNNNTYAPQHQPYYGWNPLANRSLTLPNGQDPQQSYLIMILMPNNDQGTSGLLPVPQAFLENIWGSKPSSTASHATTYSLQPTVSSTSRRPRVRSRGRQTSIPTNIFTTPRPQSSTSSVPQTSTNEQPQSSTTSNHRTSATHNSENSASPYPKTSTTPDPQRSTSPNPSADNHQSPSSPPSSNDTTASNNHPASTSSSENFTRDYQQTSTASTYQQHSTSNTEISSRDNQRSTSPSPTSPSPTSPSPTSSSSAASSTTNYQQYSTSNTEISSRDNQRSTSPSPPSPSPTSSSSAASSTTNYQQYSTSNTEISSRDNQRSISPSPPSSSSAATSTTNYQQYSTSNTEISSRDNQQSTSLSPPSSPSAATSTTNYQQYSTSDTEISSRDNQRSTSPTSSSPSTTSLSNNATSTTNYQQYSTTSNAESSATDDQQLSSSPSTPSSIHTATTAHQQSSTTNSEINTTASLQSSTSSDTESSTTQVAENSSSLDSEESSTDGYTTEDLSESDYCDSDDGSDYCDTTEDPSDAGDYNFAEAERSNSSNPENFRTLRPPHTVVPSTTASSSETSATTRDPQGTSVNVMTSSPTVTSVPRSTTRSGRTTTRHHHAHTSPPPHNISFWPCLGSAPTDASYQTVSQMLSTNGYYSEAYVLQTADNYLLCLHRIPHGRNSTPSSNRPVVLLQHGIPGSSADWLIAGRTRGLAYLLADAGYDVWMSNLRGNNYSLGHEYLDTNSDRYWSFSLDEMAIYDIPAVLDHILYQTQQPSLYAVTQSTGSAALLATLSSAPCYNHNIKAAYHLAPAVYLANNTDFLRMHNHPRTGRFNVTPEILSHFGVRRCLSHRDAVPEAICRNFRFLVGGYSHCNITKEVLQALINHSFAGTSEKSYLHYSQILASGIFRKFDYGPLSNLFVYLRKTPPEYDLGLVTAPTSIFYSELDPVVGHREVNRLLHELPNIVEVRHVPYFTHWDFLWGPRVRVDVYNHILQEMKQLNQAWWPHKIPAVCPPVSSH